MNCFHSVSDRSMSSTTDNSSFLSNTLKRRHQKRHEAEKVLEEGINSLHVSTNCNETHSTSSNNEIIYPLLNINPDSYVLDEGEERAMLEPSSYHDTNFKKAIHILIQWLNTCLRKDLIVIRSLEDDLYDGYVIGKLIESHRPNIQLELNDIPLSEDSKRTHLTKVLNYVENDFRHLNQPIKWTFDRIYNRDLISIVHLLLALMKLWNVKARYDLPKSLNLKVIIVKKVDGFLQTRIGQETFITNEHNNQTKSMIRENDLIDVLFELKPEKLPIFEKTLVHFVNTHLSSFQIRISTIDMKHFHDGLNLLYLIAELERYFLILNKYHHKQPINREQSYANFELAFLLSKRGMLFSVSHDRKKIHELFRLFSFISPSSWNRYGSLLLHR